MDGAGEAARDDLYVTEGLDAAEQAATKLRSSVPVESEVDRATEPEPEPDPRLEPRSDRVIEPPSPPVTDLETGSEPPPGLSFEDLARPWQRPHGRRRLGR